MVVFVGVAGGWCVRVSGQHVYRCHEGEIDVDAVIVGFLEKVSEPQEYL